MSLPQAPEGVLDPKYPWYNAKVGEQTWIILKAKLTGGEAFGTEYSSFVYLTSADADRLIENLKKDPRGYPQFNNIGGAKQYENLQKYQEWLVEEYLEKPFRKQVDNKIEEAAIESRMEEITSERKTLGDEKKEKAKSFISGGETSFRSGKKINAKTTSISNIIPKKTIPQEIVEKITSPSELGGGENEPVTNAPRGVVTSLGRLTLNLEQSNNNLEKIIEVIVEDYKTTKETNKKEIEDYRKRVANRGKILGKKEFGSDKVDLSGIIKKYVGSFFSGTGGAIRALAGLNLIEGIMTGDPGKILGSLTGITASYLPAIGMAIGGKVAESLGKKLFLGGARRSGGIVRGFGGVAREAKPISKLARGGGRLALGVGLAAGALAIGGKIFGGGGEAQRVGDITNPKQDGQGGADVLMPKDSLKRFDDLNTKFEQAINMLLSGGGGPAPDGVGSGPVGPSSYAPGTIPGKVKQDTQFTTGVTQLAKKYDIPEDYLYAVMGFETGGTFSPSMRNKAGSGATGLIQFMPETAKGLGTTTDALSKMTRTEQLKYVDKYFGGTLNKGGSLSDVYMSVLFPAAVGKPEDFVLFGKGAMSGYTGIAYDQNKGLDSNKDGSVTKKEAANMVTKYLPSGSRSALPPAPALPPPERVALASPTPRNIPSPGSTAQQNIQPFPVASAANAPSSGTSDGSEGPPAINTTYYENFLALYSKLIYQIV
jgi:hypothetical protein